MSAILSEESIKNILTLQPKDTWRKDEAVHLSSLLSRILFFIEEFFFEGRDEGDKKSFEDFYTKITGKIEILSADLEKEGEEVMAEIQTMLKVHAKISNSSWMKSFRTEFKPYQDYCEKVEGLRVKAEEKLEVWEKVDPTARKEIARWIRSTEKQRKFASLLDFKEVPYRFTEIPRASVILCDPFWYMKSLELKDKDSLLKTIIFCLKAFLCWCMTGKSFTHAELYLSQGKTFDLDKKEDSLLKGEMKIQDRDDKTCYGIVFAPDEDLMFEAHKKAYQEKNLTPYDSFNELWIAVEEEARNSVSKIDAGLFEVIQVGCQEKRTKTYDSMQAWEPGVKKYGCSATISALFSKFGIDIGEEFKKIDRNITPADFSTSKFFKPFFVGD